MVSAVSVDLSDVPSRSKDVQRLTSTFVGSVLLTLQISADPEIVPSPQIQISTSITIRGTDAVQVRASYTSTRPRDNILTRNTTFLTSPPAQ